MHMYLTMSCSEFAAQLRVRVLASLPTPASKLILRNVLEREGIIAPDAWVGDPDLAVIIADFCHADAELAGQDKCRHLVSRSWMMALLAGAVKTWMLRTFKASLPSGGDDARSFVEHIILPAMTMDKPKPSIRAYSLGASYASYLKVLEASPDHSLIPFGIDAFSFGAFSSLTNEERTEVLRLVKGPVSKRAMPAALKAYAAGKRAAVAAEPNALVVIIDIVDATGAKITEIRDTDNFVNISMLLASGGTTIKEYRGAKGVSGFLRSFTCAANKSLIDAPPKNSLGAYWAHAQVAIHVSEHCKLVDDLRALLRHVPDDTNPTAKLSARDAVADADEVVLYPVLDKDGVKISERRSTDDYVDAKQLGDALGKKWAKYDLQRGATEFRDELAFNLGLDTNTLVQKIASNRRTSTYVHPELAIQFVVHVTAKSGHPLDADTVRAQLYAEHEGDLEVFTVLRDTETGAAVTNQRASDGFVNATMLSNASRMTRHQCSFSFWFRSASGKAAEARAIAASGAAVKYANGRFGGSFISPVIAVEYAERCGFKIVV